MPAPSGFVHETADVAPTATISSGSKVWHYAQVREGAHLGENCIVGRGAYVGSGVQVGDNCKIQNYALVYEPARLARGVFIGPAVVLTNDHFPRAINADGTPKSGDDWQAVGVDIREGASIGASSTCIAPVVIGRWALVGAGSVVVKDVPDFALVVGSPARRVGWVGSAGHPLSRDNDGDWICPVTGARYREIDVNELVEVVT
ncbi:acyltransferase [Salinibacterium sp.]|uniref:acyltransferase n=1 Tax=Salinibacterium sp. TaxID=1915057 RepID=UPI00286ADF8D|nr:acyltransferase [Salinibacterium sp.]